MNKSKEITANQAANNLVNMYYNHSETQLEAIEISERVILTSMCQEIDSIHQHVCMDDDYDKELIQARIKCLKSKQEIVYELSKIKNKI